MRRRFLYLVFALMLVAVGCELAAQFDRSKIPADSADATTDAVIDDAADAGPRVDALAAVVPSNVAASLLDPDAGDLQGVVGIDTSALTIDVGSGPAAPPLGIKLTVTNGSVLDGGALQVAVLSVGALLVDKPISVTGSRALVILAAGSVEIRAVIDVGAHAALAGPGGFPAAAGPGAGRSGGCDSETGCQGASGAGHGTPGADATTTSRTTAGGVAYLIPLVGGSGGGTGPAYIGSPQALAAAGGGGGGSVQIFSRVVLLVTPTGGIRASGGGGARTGDFYVPPGGGGSGGFALLEAPHVTVAGTVAANGGGGGGRIGNGTDGELGSTQAGGGAPGGGSGGSLNGPPSSGGGGGAVGRILLRTRGLKADVGGVISPAPTLDTSL